MKPVLFVLLALSLAGNVIFALFAWTKPAGGETPAAATKFSSRNAGAATSGAIVQAERATESTGSADPASRWPSVTRAEDLPALVAYLRAQGFPSSVIYGIVQRQVADLFRGRRQEYTAPYWKRMVSNPERAAQQQALDKEQRELMESLLGADARPSRFIDAENRERRYGNLSDAKVDAIAAIDRDYGQLMAQVGNQRSETPQGRQDAMKQFEFLREEQRKDIAALLTPAELEQYEMRTSMAASTVMGNLRNVEVSEPEYAALFRLQQEFNRTYPAMITAPMSPEASAQRDDAQYQLNERARTILGEERYFEYLKTVDYRYNQVATTMAQYPSVTRATTYELYQLDRSTTAAAQRLPASLSREQRQAEMATLAAAYDAKLQALLGPEVAAAYGNKGAGGMFRRSNSASGAQPAIRLPGGG